MNILFALVIFFQRTYLSQWARIEFEKYDEIFLLVICEIYIYKFPSQNIFRGGL